MKKLLLSALLSLFIIISGCDVIQRSLRQAALQSTQGSLTDAQIANGLREALRVGTNNAVNTLRVKDGFYQNRRFKIPFPPEVRHVETSLRSVGMHKLVDDFIESLNRGAEEAVKEATPIFVNAIKSMTIADARSILFGNDQAATEYFRNRTSAQLSQAFTPRVKNVLDRRVNVTKAWNDITTAYNRIPGTSPVSTDLAKYVTDRAINALFIRIGEEEKKIRENPAARINNTLRQVFSALD